MRGSHCLPTTSMTRRIHIVYYCLACSITFFFCLFCFLKQIQPTTDFSYPSSDVLEMLKVFVWVYLIGKRKGGDRV